MYKISVIIPIYNAEDYLERSINSVINQTLGFENIELILVDDESKDNSRNIIENFSDKYENIKPIFLEKNTGWASIPRNIGIKNSTSDFIMFMDSDDEFSNDLCEKLYDVMIGENADLVSCNYLNIDSISTIEKIIFDYNIGNPTIKNDKVIYEDEYCLLFDNIVVWNKIFRKNIILNNNIHFNEHVAEDFRFCIEYLKNCQKRIFINDYFGYNKYLQESSLITKVDFNAFEEKINKYIFIYNIVNSQINRNQKKLFINTIFRSHVEILIEEAFNISDKKECIQCLRLIYLLEDKISFNGKLSNFVLNFFNTLILKKNFKLTFFIFKLLNISKNTNFIKKIYRLI